MNLKLCTIDVKYSEYLHKIDSKVYHSFGQKANRPFVGIVLNINKMNYYAPITSPKEKHLTMKNQEDFIKIDNGQLGVINLNNMMPIHDDSLILIETKIFSTDSKQIEAYKNLIKNQLSWCNSNKNIIYNRAEKLYNLITTGKGRNQLKERCCNFKKLERSLRIYCNENNMKIPKIPEKNKMEAEVKDIEKNIIIDNVKGVKL